jgi:hypothetical protein
MSHYCGIDLHSNNHVVVVIDEKDKRVFDKRLGFDLSMTLMALSPYWVTLLRIATGWLMGDPNYYQIKDQH